MFFQSIICNYLHAIVLSKTKTNKKTEKKTNKRYTIKLINNKMTYKLYDLRKKK